MVSILNWHIRNWLLLNPVFRWNRAALNWIFVHLTDWENMMNDNGFDRNAKLNADVERINTHRWGEGCRLNWMLTLVRWVCLNRLKFWSECLLIICKMELFRDRHSLLLCCCCFPPSLSLFFNHYFFPITCERACACIPLFVAAEAEAAQKTIPFLFGILQTYKTPCYLF